MSDMSEMIKSAIDGVKNLQDAQTTVGSIITTPSGVTVVPISKNTVGFVGGGADYGQKKLSQNQSFAGGSGGGISISPIAFLTISPDSSVNVIHLNGDVKTGAERIASIIDRSPEIVERIKNILS